MRVRQRRGATAERQVANGNGGVMDPPGAWVARAGGVVGVALRGSGLDDALFTTTSVRPSARHPSLRTLSYL